MKSLKDKRKAPKSVSNGMTGTILITLLITLLFAALIYGMYVLNIISFFDVSDFFSGKENNSSLIENSDDLYDSLNIVAPSDEYKFLYEVTPDELTVILSSFEDKTHYSISAEIVNYSSSKSMLTRIQAERDGDVFDIIKYVGSELTESIQSDGAVVTVTDETRGRSAKHKFIESFGFEPMCAIPSLSDLTAICDKVFSEESDDVIDYDISLVSSGDQSFYKAVFTYPDIMQREEYYVSPDTQMIVNAYSYLNDSLYYRYSLLDYNVIGD